MAREDFSKMLKQLRPVLILGMNEQVILIRQRLAWPRIDRVWPQDDGPLVGSPAVLSDQVRVPFGVAEYRSAVGCIQQSSFFGINPWRSGMLEQHVRTMHERQPFRIPPSRVTTVGPVQP
ncbi:hypothetical protein [Bythopirellula goksoeyrii]|uniref:hypothetical protein n=1 Tax=Bythopirellula goksoeyrii TaxID=1400387 RepID=UPI001AEFA538|nr:hypothetical protein [Bythopirellula goksoeyrii]